MNSPPKLLVLADAASIHTEKWIYGLSLCDAFDIYLITMNPAGVRPGIRDNSSVKGVFEVYSADVHHLGNNFHYAKNLLPIYRIVKSLRPDVITTIYLTSYGLIGSLFKRTSVLAHFMIGTDIMVTPFSGVIGWLVTKYALSRGDLLISSSRAMSERLKRLATIPANQLLTQQYGVADEVITHPPQEKRYDFISNRAWVPNSNIGLILDVFNSIETSLRLAVVGNGGDDEAAIKEKIALLRGAVHLGSLPYMENIRAVAQSRFYVSLTASDGASLSLMEAMAIGAIPVVSNIQPNREWIEDGVNGFVVDLENKDRIIEKFRYIAELPDADLEQMRARNRAIIQERGRLTTNMRRVSDKLLQLLERQRN